MDNDAGSIQNEFFNRARKDRAVYDVVLTNGTRLTGRVLAFDKFTVLLDTGRGEQMVFKHAIASVMPSAAGAGAKGPSSAT
jgi:host factor-I protein